MKMIYVFAIVIAALANTSNALIIDFNLRGTAAKTALDDTDFGTFTVNGVSATFTAIVEGNTGLMNQTTTGFGINAEDTGDDTNDATNLLDGEEGAESISISFSQSVLFTELRLSSYTSPEVDSAAAGTDVAELTLNGFSAITPAPISGPDVFLYSSSNLISIGDTVVLKWVSYNGFSFDGFKIDTAVPLAAVPESGTTLTFLGLAAFGLILFRRFQT